MYITSLKSETEHFVASVSVLRFQMNAEINVCSCFANDIQFKNCLMLKQHSNVTYELAIFSYSLISHICEVFSYISKWNLIQ